jgi:DNA mismatch endonuclease (patch repair protein)
MTAGARSTPHASSAEALKRMTNQRRRDTKPEMAIRRLVHARGMRYRVDAALPRMRRRADLLFTASRVAVFIDGCFWHGCPEHGTKPKNNDAWWAAKIAANTERDRDTDQRLTANGWSVLRFWEHEAPEAAADRIAETVRNRRRVATGNANVMSRDRLPGRTGSDRTTPACSQP